MLVIGNSTDLGFYASEPGVGAGSTQGFTAVAAVVAGASMVPDPGNRGLLSNFDEGANRGWKLHYFNSGTRMGFGLELGLNDGNTFTSSVELHSMNLQFALVGLTLGDEGANASVVLTVNGAPVIFTNLGVGLSFAPATNTPLEIGAPTSFPLLASDIQFMGAAFSNTFVSVAGMHSRSMYAFTNERLAPSFGSYGSVENGVAFFDHAWDTQSLLNSPVQFNVGQRSSAGDIWEPSPDSGPEFLTLQSTGPEPQPPIFINYKPSALAPAIAPGG